MIAAIWNMALAHLGLNLPWCSWYGFGMRQRDLEGSLFMSDISLELESDLKHKDVEARLPAMLGLKYSNSIVGRKSNG